jgi:O-antigen ligase
LKSTILNSGIGLKPLNNKQLKLAEFLLPIVFGLALLGVSIFSFVASKESSEIVYAPPSALSYASMALFVIVSLFGLYSTKLYFALLIFVLWAFPAPVNDFFPGTWLGEVNEFGNAIFPFFTHIDIYLLLGITKGVLKNKGVNLHHSSLFFITIAGMFVSIFANMFDFRNTHERLLLLQGMFQFRYLLELYLLLAFFSVSVYKNELKLGFIISLLFLLIESVLFTLKSHGQELESGSLANNVFASSVSAVLLFLVYVRKRYNHSRIVSLLMLLSMIAAVFMIIASGARMAILAFLVTYFIYSFIEKRKKRSVLKIITWVISLLVFLSVVMNFADKLPKKYNPYTISERVEVRDFNWDLTKFVHIERSWETNSLISRLQLYSASLKMFRRNPICGIGVGRWNLQKQQYGFYERLLIDSHNGYLSVISQYGLLGIPLIFFLFFSPIAFLIRNNRNKETVHFIFYLGLINLFFAFSDFSNSGIFKHQIFALLAFNAICLFQLRKKVSSTSETSIPPTQ